MNCDTLLREKLTPEEFRIVANEHNSVVAELSAQVERMRAALHTLLDCDCDECHACACKGLIYSALNTAPNAAEPKAKEVVGSPSPLSPRRTSRARR